MISVTAMALLLAARPASALLITFDDLPLGNTPFGGIYDGFDWSSPGYPNFGGVLTNGDGYAALTVSGPNYAYAYCCEYADTISQVGPGTFDFISGYFGNVQSAAAMSWTVRGFLGLSELYTVTLNNVGPTPQLFALNMMGIDSVKFDSNFEQNLGMDNLLFNESSAPPTVPEPGSVVLLGTGLIVGLTRLWKGRTAA